MSVPVSVSESLIVFYFAGGTIRAPYGHGRRVATPTYGIPEGDRLWSGGLREREKDKWVIASCAHGMLSVICAALPRKCC